MGTDKNKDKQLQIDISPEMQIYKVLQHLSYGIETALAELIDNAIQSYVEGRQLPDGGGLDERLSIKIDISEDTITMTDTARGIGIEAIQRALKPGFESNHPSESLSVYGIGMKSAALWFSEDWGISTSVPGEPYSLNFNFNLPKLLANHSETEAVVIEDEKPEAHYTTITMRNVTRNESKSYYEETVIPFLLETFFRFSDFLDLKIYYNNLLLKPNSKKLLLTVPEPHIYPEVNSKGLITGKTPVEWIINLNFLYEENKTVRGFILLRETGGYGQPGIRLLRNNRVIEGTSVYPNIPNELLGTKNKYAAQRVYGELELDDFPVDFMKTQFNDNLKKLFEKISTQLSDNCHFNIIKQATGYRKKEADKPENQELVERMLKTIAPVRADIKEFEESPETGNGEDTDTQKPMSAPVKGPNGGATPPTSSGGTDNTDGGNNSEAPTGFNPAPSGGGNGGYGSFEPQPDNRIEMSEKLLYAFSRLPGDKLPQLYTSLCTVSLRKHAVMCYVAAWSLIESWSSAIGKTDGTDFSSFLNPKVASFAKDKSKKADLRQVLDDIKSKGNCNKHSAVYGNSHALDLKKDFIILEPFIISATDQYFNEQSA